MKKKFLALFLMAALVLAQGITVFAQEPPKDTNNSDREPLSPEEEEIYWRVNRDARCEHSLEICPNCRGVMEKVKGLRNYPDAEPNSNIVVEPSTDISKGVGVPIINDALVTEAELRHQCYLKSFSDLQLEQLSFVNTEEYCPILKPDTENVTHLELGHDYDLRLVMPATETSDEGDWHHIAIQVLAPVCLLKPGQDYTIRVRILDNGSGNFFEYTTTFQTDEDAMFVLTIPKKPEINTVENVDYLTFSFRLYDVDEAEGIEPQPYSSYGGTSSDWGTVDWYINHFNKRITCAAVEAKAI